MISISEKVQEYIKKLGIIKRISNDELITVCKFIIDLNTEEISANYASVSCLFCRCIESMNQENVPAQQITTYIISAFDNISRGSIDNSVHNTYIVTMLFLNKIASLNSEIGECDVIDDAICEEFNELVENLDKIKILFKLKKEDKYYFPIGKLLSTIIRQDKLLYQKLDTKTLDTLLLALQVFRIEEYAEEKDKIDELINSCRLKCLRYLNNPCIKKFDNSTWRTNFEKNGVLILADKSKKKILIRHEDKNYFKDLPYDLQSELNQNGDEIAYYIEIDYNGDCVFTSIEDILMSNNTNQIIQLFNLFFCEKNYNILYDGAIINEGGVLRTVNPATTKDEFIIRKQDYQNSWHRVTEVILYDILNNYSLKILGGKGLDNLIIGVVIRLLTIHPMPLDNIIPDMEHENNLQNRIIQNWLSNCEDPVDSIIKFQKLYYDELSYTKKRESFEEKKFQNIGFYPISLDIVIINQILQKLFNATGEFIKVKIEVNFNGSFSYEELMTQNNITELIEYFDADQRESIEIDMNEVYALKIFGEGTSRYIIDSNINKLGEIRNNILNGNRYLINHDELGTFLLDDINDIVDSMELHIDALKDMENINCDFASNALFRIVNNVLCYNLISPERWRKFLEIINFHQKLKFGIVRNTGFIDIFEDGVLIIPKESAISDSALYSIYNEYLAGRAVRSKNYIFEPKVTKRNGKYFIHSKEIRKIVFLFDTLQNGKATIDALSYYFENHRVTCRENNSIMIMCNENEVLIEEIINANGPEIAIKCIYGTDYGVIKLKEYIDTQLQPHNILENATIEYLEPINSNVTNDFLDKAYELYGDSKGYLGTESYAVIREFNQPKQNIFPKHMLNPYNVISLFAKKRERNNSI